MREQQLKLKMAVRYVTRQIQVKRAEDNGEIP